eukprot:TRINITY_DN8020_c0_g1_i1.p1 TRINITY_DN8020_c0_g1~~TRINITY_DN8020_c0_g1_i1.p1  ORF type:complete len:343 (-),score=86.73 TRINITY_DN8020_c0_g1_i1:6-1034(-)
METRKRGDLIKVGIFSDNKDTVKEVHNLLSDNPGLLSSIDLEVINSSQFQLKEGEKDEIPSLMSKFEVVLVEPDLVSKSFRENQSFKVADGLKWMQSTWAGINAFRDLEGGKRTESPHFTFTKLGDAFGPLIASYCLGYIINLERHLMDYKQFQKESNWEKKTYRPLAGIKIGILGYGNIGREIAKHCRSFGMEILILNRGNSKEKEVVIIDSLEEMLGKSDYLISVLPKTQQTDNLLSGNVMSHCKPGCVFINVGRGNIIDDQSILKALDEKWISAAVLDVFNKEPLPKGNPLWKRENVYITPHISGVSLSADIAKVFVKNLEKYASGNQLDHVVDWEKGY